MRYYVFIDSPHNVFEVNQLTTGFVAPIGGNEDIHFGPGSPEPPAQKVPPLSSPPLRSPGFTFPAFSSPPRHMEAMVGCKINLDQTDPYPFLSTPFVFYFDGMKLCSITFELPNCMSNFAMEVEPSQREASLSFEVDDKVMQPYAIFCNMGLGSGNIFYESAIKWRKNGRKHDDLKWEGMIRIKLPFKCEFDTYDNLPSAANHSEVNRIIGEDEDGNQIVLKTILFVFRACSDNFKANKEVVKQKTFNCF
jgi:hypothetical protein